MYVSPSQICLIFISKDLRPTHIPLIQVTYYNYLQLIIRYIFFLFNLSNHNIKSPRYIIQDIL